MVKEKRRKKGGIVREMELGWGKWSALRVDFGGGCLSQVETTAREPRPLAGFLGQGTRQPRGHSAAAPAHAAAQRSLFLLGVVLFFLLHEVLFLDVLEVPREALDLVFVFLYLKIKHTNFGLNKCFYRY